MLCHKCQGIFQGQLMPVQSPSELFLSPKEAHWKKGQDQYSGTIQQSFVGIRESALHGCYICDSIQQDAIKYWTRLSNRFQGEFAAEGPMTHLCSIWKLHWIIAFDSDNFSLAIDVRVGEDFGIDATNAKWLEPYFSLVSAHELSSHERATLTKTPLPRLDYAEQWLGECNATHSECNENVKDIAYPTRLLELGSPQAGSIRLKNTAEASITSPYMTLSHCWGTANFLRLTTETSTELYRGIDATRLARTFQDAAIVAKSLGASYLWIDSLCIFQDSAEDWRKESSIMGDIYAGGQCNIAAIAAEDSNATSMPLNEGNGLNEPCEITTMWRNRQNNRYRICRRWPWKEDVDETPLMNRGWVVQERVLSPRILYLGKRQVFWECQKLQACQVFPRGIPDSSFLRYPIKLAIPTRWQQQSSINSSLQDYNCSEGNFPDFHVSWASALTLYSMCRLTRETDKLIALSGIARTCHAALHDRYLAGIWESALPFCLLWARDHNTYCHQPEVYLAPSWSWASVIGPLKFPPHSAPDHIDLVETGAENLVSVVGVHVETAWGDPFGQVSGGWMRLSGPLWTIEVMNESSITSSTGSKISHYTWIHINNWKVYQEDFTKSRSGLRLDTESVNISCLHFMPFLSRPAMECKGDGFETWGLVLKPTGVLRGQFRRVGFLQIRTPTKLYGVSNAKDDVFSNTSWLGYEAMDNTGN
ncbi:hypothetical protein EG329_009703 [Mollisiaceae sp. DMI_Dod_QoI]|nr:hypothetical protein EG329_009703 [Helotiales sp. DMI_Dod_QoI]